MENFSTIHIFAYGEAQVISKDLNFKTVATDFKKLQAVIDNVKSKKPKDVKAKDYHAINIFPKNTSYISSEKGGSFDIKTSALDEKKIDALVAEFATLKAAKEAEDVG